MMTREDAGDESRMPRPVPFARAAGGGGGIYLCETRGKETLIGAHGLRSRGAQMADQSKAG
jgi:hypothetical protein